MVRNGSARATSASLPNGMRRSSWAVIVCAGPTPKCSPPSVVWTSNPTISLGSVTGVAALPLESNTACHAVVRPGRGGEVVVVDDSLNEH